MLRLATSCGNRSYTNAQQMTTVTNNGLPRSKIKTDRLFFCPRYLAPHCLATTSPQLDRQDLLGQVRRELDETRMRHAG